MGTDCAPVVANLFLFAYEYEFMKGLLKDNITLAINPILIGILMTFYVLTTRILNCQLVIFTPKNLILKRQIPALKNPPFRLRYNHY